METTATIGTGEVPKSSPVYLNTDGIQSSLPRLQIIDDSSQSKPDNYRVSPITPQSTEKAPPATLAPTVDSSTETKTDLDLILEDWSGRGAHVDFQPTEQVPLKEGRFLGQGSMGAVYETTIKGYAFAWKRRFCRRCIGDAERKEVEILKKVSHHHIIRLAGSYTHQHFLGLLLYPVAFYDLATLLEDTEALISRDGDNLLASQYERLKIFCNFDDYVLDKLEDNEPPSKETLFRMEVFLRPFILSKIGCIISAVEYLHSQRIRHKDLKPSNILLSEEGLWVTDFGTATDFSLQTISMTENMERGTPKYFAPEIASYQPSGRAADIFSLGCVVLEMYATVHDTLPAELKHLRSARDKSFHANLEPVLQWLHPTLWSYEHTVPFNGDYFGINIRRELSRMLAREPDSRPLISEVRKRFALIDTVEEHNRGYYLFGACCRKPFLSPEEHDNAMLETTQAHQKEIEKMKVEHASELERLRRFLEQAHEESVKLHAQAKKEKEELIRKRDSEIASLRTERFALHDTMGGQSPSSSTSAIQCHICRAPFEGKYAWKDLERHRFEIHGKRSNESAQSYARRINNVVDPWDIVLRANATSRLREQDSTSLSCPLCFKAVTLGEDFSKHIDYYHPAEWAGEPPLEGLTESSSTAWSRVGDDSTDLQRHESLLPPAHQDSGFAEPPQQSYEGERVRQSLDQSVADHATALTHRCDICNWTTHSRRALRRHIDHMHTATSANSNKYMV